MSSGRKSATRRPKTSVHNFSCLVLPVELLGTAFWNEFLVRRAPTFHGLSLLVEQPDEVIGVFTVWRQRGAEAFDGRCEAWLRQLESHLRRAFIAESRLAAASQSIGALDALRQGIAIVRPDGRSLMSTPRSEPWRRPRTDLS